ncbi:hypothetical protein TsocGM_14415 [Tautonia sociabilis]|uniref:Uncharacterized protein n=1 Tax=Tautonia sociabilis TaxID=2080755 RepID=A0A432MIC8_9BACT|nr:hypothetical protein TsocGM_14415 [Tautonia sociabilis]
MPVTGGGRRLPEELGGGARETARGRTPGGALRRRVGGLGRGHAGAEGGRAAEAPCPAAAWPPRRDTGRPRGPHAARRLRRRPAPRPRRVGRTRRGLP